MSTFTLIIKIKISNTYSIRLIFLGVAPIALVSWLNLKIYLVIKQSGKGAVKTGDSACQGDELRRNISMGRNNGNQQLTNVNFKERCQDETNVTELTSESDLVAPCILHLDIEEDKNQDETNTKHRKKNERVQFIILFSIILLFILCNIPRITLLIHQVLIIDTIK